MSAKPVGFHAAALDTMRLMRTPQLVPMSKLVSLAAAHKASQLFSMHSKAHERAQEHICWGTRTQD